MARTHYLSPNLYNKLYAVMQYENALALRVSLETGWRIGDVLELKVDDLKGRTLYCTAQQKTGKPDKKTISADLAKRLLQISANGRLFDGRFGNAPRRRQTVWKDVKKAARQLELDGNIAPHSARKTYAVEDFHEHGLRHTQDALSHDSVNTTMLYAFADLIDKTPALTRRLTDGGEGATMAQAITSAQEEGQAQGVSAIDYCAAGATCKPYGRAEWAALLDMIRAVVGDTVREVLTEYLSLDKS